MKLMEIFKLRIQCINAMSPELKSRKSALREMVKTSYAAQEYYISGELVRDAISEIENAVTHPYLYDGMPVIQTGASKIIAKYGLADHAAQRQMYDLASALQEDIQNGTIPKNGAADLTAHSLVNSHILNVRYRGARPNDGLGLVLIQMMSNKTK